MTGTDDATAVSTSRRDMARSASICAQSSGGNDAGSAMSESQYWMTSSGPRPARADSCHPSGRLPIERTRPRTRCTYDLEVGGYSAGLEPADVDVRASKDGCNAGQHLLDHFKGRRQLWVQPRGDIFLTRRRVWRRGSTSAVGLIHILAP